MVKPKKRIRKTAAESREIILQNALRIMAASGWVAMSFQSIADASSTSQSNILYHFKTKEDLLVALLDKISRNNFDIVSAGIKPDHDAYERLRLHIQKNLEWAIKYPQEAQIIILVYYQATHDAKFAKVFKDILDRAQQRIYEHILSGMREGIFKPTLPPLVTAQMLHNLLVGAFINVMSGRMTKVKNYSQDEWSQAIALMAGHSTMRL